MNKQLKKKNADNIEVFEMFSFHNKQRNSS